MNQKDMKYIRKGIRLMTKHMRKINKELKKANALHADRFAKADTDINSGIRRTDGRI